MQFIAPKNFKNGRLIQGRWRLWELVAMLITIAISSLSVITYATIGGKNIALIIALLLPSAIAWIGTMNNGIYHNVFTLIATHIRFLKKKKIYIWEGVHLTDDDQAEED